MHGESERKVCRDGPEQELFCQPADFDQTFDRLELGVTGQYSRVRPLSSGNAKGVGIGKRVFTFDLSCGSDQRLIYWKKLNRKLFQKPEGLCRLGAADASLDDIEKFASRRRGFDGGK